MSNTFPIGYRFVDAGNGLTYEVVSRFSGGWAHVISTPGGRHGFIRRNDLRAMIASGKATKGGAS